MKSLPSSRYELSTPVIVRAVLVIVQSDLGHVDLEDVIVLQSFLGLPCVVVLPHKQVNGLRAINQLLVLSSPPGLMIIFHRDVIQPNVLLHFVIRGSDHRQRINYHSVIIRPK